MPTTRVNRHAPRNRSHAPSLNKTLKSSVHRNGHHKQAMPRPQSKTQNPAPQQPTPPAPPSPIPPASAPPRPPPTPPPPALRIAAIDIGTNSLHMVIVEVT